MRIFKYENLIKCLINFKLILVQFLFQFISSLYLIYYNNLYKNLLLMNILVYAREWSYFQVENTLKNYQSFLNTFPANLFQLNFWTEIMMVAWIKEIDVPNNAVYYLSDESYEVLLSKLNLQSVQKMKINFKIAVLLQLFKIQKNDTLIRQLEEAVIAGCSLHPSSSLEYAKLKKLSIKNYLLSMSEFLSDFCLEQVTLYFCDQIFSRKEIKQMNDLTLGAFLVQQLQLESNQDSLKRFLVLSKKQNAFDYLADYFSTHRPLYLIQPLIYLAECFNRMESIMNIFEENSEYFYQLFWTITHSYKTSRFKSFVSFMLNYSSIKTIILHHSLQALQIRDEQKIAEQSTVHELLIQKNRLIFEKFKFNPELTASQCIKAYLNMSNFHIPQKKIKSTYFDPLASIGIIRKYWDDQFHNHMINFSIWILLDRRIARLSLSSYKTQDVKNYCRNLFLALFHIAISYKLGTFVIYYPMQNSKFQDLFSLQTLPSLLVKCSDLSRISWVSTYITNQLHRIIRMDNGYNLISRSVDLRIGSIESNGPIIFNFIDHDLINIRTNKNILNNKSEIVRLLSKLKQYKSLRQTAEKLGKTIESLSFSHQ